MKMRKVDHFTTRDEPLNRALKEFESNVEQGFREAAKDSAQRMHAVRIDTTRTLVRPGDRVFVTRAPIELLVPELSPEDNGKELIIINGADTAGNVTVRAIKTTINGAATYVSGVFVIRILIEAGRLWV